MVNTDNYENVVRICIYQNARQVFYYLVFKRFLNEFHHFLESNIKLLRNRTCIAKTDYKFYK